MQEQPDGNIARSLVAAVSEQFSESDLYYGHGTDNPQDEAVYLVFETLGLDYHCPESELDERRSEEACRQVMELCQQRIETRKPLAYLLKRAWFAGLAFYVDERVLVPRSPLAELILNACQPWVQPERVHRVLEIGTGSGCIGIACAYAFAEAQVDVADISEDALAVARRNVEEHGLCERVSLYLSDIYDGLPARQYDLIISNPPYVPTASMQELPAEYLHEPSLGLVSGDSGLDIVNRMLKQADRFLSEEGVMIIEVGESQPQMMESWPDLPLIWLEFEHGGEGVFAITARELRRALSPA